MTRLQRFIALSATTHQRFEMLTPEEIHRSSCAAARPGIGCGESAVPAFTQERNHGQMTTAVPSAHADGRLHDANDDVLAEEHIGSRLHGAMMQMYDSMMRQEMTGDADRDFVVMMIAPHEAAVAMAQTELKYGRNAQVKALARRIIAAQDAEFRQMRKLQGGVPR